MRTNTMVHKGKGRGFLNVRVKWVVYNGSSALGGGFSTVVGWSSGFIFRCLVWMAIFHRFNPRWIIHRFAFLAHVFYAKSVLPLGNRGENGACDNKKLRMACTICVLLIVLLLEERALVHHSFSTGTNTVDPLPPPASPGWSICQHADSSAAPSSVVPESHW